MILILIIWQNNIIKFIENQDNDQHTVNYSIKANILSLEKFSTKLGHNSYDRDKIQIFTTKLSTSGKGLNCIHSSLQVQTIIFKTSYSYL